jgi:dTDP-4-dehydrorhamnose 3,5-epimerase
VIQVRPTSLRGLVHLVPTVRADERGFFVETFRDDAMAEIGVDGPFVQDNHSRSRRDTLRGLHFQIGAGQGKLVRVARGRIVDVVVDIRRSSPTFGAYEAVELDDVAHHQLYVPVGFAHGFVVLSDEADVCYRVTSYYDHQAERGIVWNDPDIGIQWRVRDPLLSPRDRDLPSLAGLPDLPDW